MYYVCMYIYICMYISPFSSTANPTTDASGKPSALLQVSKVSSSKTVKQ